ncbi:hypothetical protein AAMO2058_000254500 [Amorphochlora amoebiformis]
MKVSIEIILCGLVAGLIARRGKGWFSWTSDITQPLRIPLHQDSVPQEPNWSCVNHTDCCASIESCNLFCNRVNGEEGGHCKDRWQELCFDDRDCERGEICMKSTAMDTAGNCTKDIACNGVNCGPHGQCVAGRCRCSFPNVGPRCTGSTERKAYVTLIFDGSGPGIAMMTRAWAKSLRLAGAVSDIVALITPGLSADFRNILGNQGIRMIQVHAVPLPPSLRSKEASSRWHSVFTKLRAWQLTQYDKVAFMDVDIIFEKINDNGSGIEEIFNSCGVDLCMARDLTHTKDRPMGNVGVMILKPSKSRFHHMMESLKTLRKNFKYPEQEWLTLYLLDPQSNMIGRLLPHLYNTCSLPDDANDYELHETQQSDSSWILNEFVRHKLSIPKDPSLPSYESRLPEGESSEKVWGREGAELGVRRPAVVNVIVHHFCGPSKPTHYRPSEAIGPPRREPEKNRQPLELDDKRDPISRIRLWHKTYLRIDKCWGFFDLGACHRVKQCRWVQVARKNFVSNPLDQNADYGFCVHDSIAKVASASSPIHVSKLASLPLPSLPHPSSTSSNKTSPINDLEILAATQRAWDIGVTSTETQNFQTQNFAFTLDANPVDSRPFEETVLYQIVTDRFAPSSLQKWERCVNLTRRCGGSWLGIEQSMRYLVDLGISSIWLSPVHENINPDLCYHGYCPKGMDAEQLSRAFGGRAAFHSLRDSMRLFGIKLMGDIVINHIGSRMEDLSDGLLGPHAFGSNINARYFHDPQRPGWCKPNMTPKEMVECSLYGAPDLNHSDPLVAREVIRMVRESVELLGFDAVRLDAARHVEPRFLAKLSESITVTTFGEILHGNFYMVGGFQNVIPGLFNFPLHFSLVDAFQRPRAKALGPTMENALRLTHDAFRQPRLFINFVENHDLPRFLSRKGSDEALYINAITTILFWEGIPALYYGGELGLKGQKSPHPSDPLPSKSPTLPEEPLLDADGFERYLPDRHREPLWESPYFRSFLEDSGTSSSPPALYELIRALISVRESVGVWGRSQTTLLSRNTVYAFARGPAVVIVNNLGGTQAYPHSSPNGTSVILIPHPFDAHTRLCNVLPPFRCLLIEPEAGEHRKEKGAAFRHRIHRGMPAVYVPMSEQMSNIMLKILYALPAFFSRPSTIPQLENTGTEDIFRPNPINFNHDFPTQVFNPVASFDDKNPIGPEPSFRLTTQNSTIFTVAMRSILLTSQFMASDPSPTHSEFRQSELPCSRSSPNSCQVRNQKQAICLFRTAESHMSCSKAVKRLRGRDGWGAAARANVMDVESVLIVLHWLQVDNYYHFLAEIFPYVLEEISKLPTEGPIPGITKGHYLGLPIVKRVSFIDAVLRNTGFNPWNIIQLHSPIPQIIRTKSTVVIPGIASHTRPSVSASPKSLRAAREWLRHCPSLKISPRLRNSVVWIGREGASVRRIRNAAKLKRVLQDAMPEGVQFEWITPGKEPKGQSLTSTIQKIASARVIVGVHGAGLANILFAHPDTHVVEVIPTVPGMINYHYWTMSAALKLSYKAIPMPVMVEDLTQVCASEYIPR